MKISILCSDDEHPIYQRLIDWKIQQDISHQIEIVNRKSELPGGKLLFLVSCHEMLHKEERSHYEKVLVIHASNLPEGKGWSPHVWQILEGKNKIVVSLIEAEDKIDSGAIWQQQTINLEGHELNDEINNQLFDLELQLMNFAVENFDEVQPKVQSRSGSTSYPKRRPEDSFIDVTKTIEEQFDLLRVVDHERYPAFFDFRGHRYKIKLEKY